ncbi:MULTISPECIES: hypothetical protein [Campylobacter]|uniref:hypothetical protein n=2 Tax=Campylobacteraceae TaxID=72294 RepID=UPI002584E5D7|nr:MULTISPECIES: hypothetical protein [Campylobacter]MCI6642407.1 hypothetical protein [Campylobacter sp.]MDD7422733.1 hypothetical protein [Campylobacter hominis]MDY3116512.1 hypothetical protein [Campylobacter hominis]
MMKKGFSLIAAIFFIMLISTIALTSLSIATMSAREAPNILLNQQAELLARSATEYAIMNIQQNDYDKGCPDSVKEINLNYPSKSPIFNVKVQIYYLNSALKRFCGDNVISSSTALADNYKLASIIDVRVTSVGNIGSAPIKFSRRTLQIP